MNYDIIFLIINFICISWTIITLVGYALYKNRDEINSWEEGIKRIMTWGFNWFYEEATGQDIKKNIPFFTPLTNTEVLQLVNNFAGHPYDTPVLYSYVPNLHGISWYDIRALGLTQTYMSLSNNNIAQMAEFIIQTYFMRTRNTQITVYIRVASPIRLYFAIPLSQNGDTFLQKQSQLATANVFSSVNLGSPNGLNPSVDSGSSVDSDSLEEEIDIFED